MHVHDVHALVLILTHIGDFTDFFQDLTSDNETYHSVLGSDGVYRDSYVH